MRFQYKDREVFSVRSIIAVCLVTVLLLVGCPKMGAATRTAVLTWTASAVDATHDAATGYNVYRSTVTGACLTTPVAAGCTKLTAAPVTVTNFSDATIVVGLTYFFVVRGVNATGESNPSLEAGTGVVPGTVPNPPGALTVIVN